MLPSLSRNGACASNSENTCCSGPKLGLYMKPHIRAPMTAGIA
jgi:hypothetical protein